MEKMKELLLQVNAMVEKSRVILDATGARFNMFRTLGVNHYENTHSAILAELLSPKGSHSQGDEFLKLFVSKVCANIDFDTSIARVITEKHTPYGRMDIVIESGKSALIIENKIYASDQWEQLKRYDDYAKKTYSSYKLFYLTLWGNEASDDSAKDVEYEQISYASNILDWIDGCAKIAFDTPIVRETLKQYNNHIKTLTGMSIENKTQNDIVKLLTKDKEAFESAVQIVRAYDNVAREHVFQTVFQEKLRNELALIDCELKDLAPNHRITPWYKIDVTPKTWSRFSISFEFGSKGARNIYYGIVDHSNNKERDKELELQLMEKFQLKSTAWWYFYKYLVTHRSWNGNEYIMMYDEKSSLYTEIIDCVKYVIENTRDLDM